MTDTPKSPDTQATRIIASGCRLCGRPAGFTGLVDGVHPVCRLLQIAIEMLDEVGPLTTHRNPLHSAVRDEIRDDLDAFAERCSEPDVVIYTARTLAFHMNIQPIMREEIISRRDRPDPPVRRRRPTRDH